MHESKNTIRELQKAQSEFGNKGAKQRWHRLSLFKYFNCDWQRRHKPGCAISMLQ
ncbi:MAG: hypothetical protein H3C43_00795 [Leptonema sp. (in: Bacteria)]|nr:hypothetical protein [Leptonema sp. (in: bacteria)]